MPLLAGAEVGLWCSFAYAAQAVGPASFFQDFLSLFSHTHTRYLQYDFKCQLSLQTGNAGKSAFICALAVLVVPFLDAAKVRIPASPP